MLVFGKSQRLCQLQDFVCLNSRERVKVRGDNDDQNGEIRPENVRFCLTLNFGTPGWVSSPECRRQHDQNKSI
jgi:hypothetical protein